MKIKKYEVNDMKEALSLIKKDLGPDAVILTTRKIMKPTGLGLFPKPMLEVTAAAGYNEDDERTSKLYGNSNPVKTSRSRVQTNLSNDLSQVKDTSTVSDDEIVIRSRSRSKSLDVVVGDEDTEDTAHDSVLNLNKNLQDIPNNNNLNKIIDLMDKIGFEKLESLATDLADIKQQLADIKTTVSEPSVSFNNNNLPENLAAVYNILLKNGVDEVIAYRILKSIEKNSHSDIQNNKIIDNNGIIEQIQQALPIVDNYILSLKNKVIAFIGPTGVGKTTTIAKMAAELVLHHSKKVCLVTIDNFRIGAVEQLKIYAEIVNLPLYVATSPKELEKILGEVAYNYEYILLDSTGRSPYDTEKVCDLAPYLKAYEDIVTVLTLSLSGNHGELGEMFDLYSGLNPSYLIFTKLDETRYFGPILNIPVKKKLPVLLLSTGQSVPDDIEVPDGRKIANKLLKEIPVLWNEN